MDKTELLEIYTRQQRNWLELSVLLFSAAIGRGSSPLRPHLSQERSGWERPSWRTGAMPSLRAARSPAQQRTQCGASVAATIMTLVLAEGGVGCTLDALLGGNGCQAGLIQVQISEGDVALLLAARLDPREPACPDTWRK